jgi:hypothetical protein
MAIGRAPFEIDRPINAQAPFALLEGCFSSFQHASSSIMVLERCFSSLQGPVKIQWANFSRKMQPYLIYFFANIVTVYKLD